MDVTLGTLGNPSLPQVWDLQEAMKRTPGVGTRNVLPLSLSSSFFPFFSPVGRGGGPLPCPTLPPRPYRDVELCPLSHAGAQGESAPSRSRLGQVESNSPFAIRNLPFKKE